MKSSSPTPAPPSSNPRPPPLLQPLLSRVMVSRRRNTLRTRILLRVVFFYHGALSLQVIHTGRNKTLLDSVIFMAFFYPQLLQGQKDGKCFEKFQEGELTFPPTYKYNPGTDQWDTER